MSVLTQIIEDTARILEPQPTTRLAKLLSWYRGFSLDRAGLGAVHFVIGGYGYLIAELIGLLSPPT